MAMKLTLQTGAPPKKNPARDFDQDSDSDSDLPFPEPLPRAAFLDPSFTPQKLLATLTSRHQTLSDLRGELSSRSQTIASELLTLVNNEYQSFLGLGSDLKGGEEKVEEVKLGVLGLTKGVNGLKEHVKQRENEVKQLLSQRTSVTNEISLGRALLRVADDIEEMEEALALRETNSEVAWSDEEADSDTSEGDQTQGLVRFGRLQRLVQQYSRTRTQIERLGGSSHPFLATQQEKMIAVRKTLLIDLGTALKQARNADASSKVVRLMSLYTTLDSVPEALQILKIPKH